MFLKQEYAHLQAAARKVSGQDPLWEELLHLCLEDFIYKPNVEEIVNSGGGRFYLVRMMMNQYRSTTSPFYKIYRTPAPELEESWEEPVELEPEPDLQEQVQSLLDKLPWYDSMLFKIYVEESHSVSSLARATGIPRTSVNLTLTRVKKFLKKNLKNSQL